MNETEALLNYEAKDNVPQMHNSQTKEFARENVTAPKSNSIHLVVQHL